jgi:murein DD-endopeptidase MepM/ murein hydrolase activator NlpD
MTRRRVVAGLILAAVALGIYNNTRELPAVRAAWKQLALPWRALRLSMQEPDAVLLMPVEAGQLSRVADTWHAPRPDGRRHEGVDIFAPFGTPVYSATAGVVLRTGKNRLGGNVVFVLAAGGRSYYYAHLSAHAPGLQTGDVVSTGTVLGCVGTSGNARGTPPHLHFGAYTSSGAFNPLPLLVNRAREEQRSRSAVASHSTSGPCGPLPQG